MVSALCGRLHHRWMEQRGSEHFLQLGLAVHVGQDGSALDGVVVLVEGKGAGDALDGAAGNGIDDGLLVLVRAGLEALLLGSLDAVHDGHGGIVAQRCKAVGVSFAVLGLVGILKRGAGALSVAGAEVGVLQLVGGGVALQTIPAIAAEEGNGQADALGLRKDLTHFLIVVALAAALIMLTPWKGDRILVDPFCGSGTFPIEAAMMAADIAPGLNRSFLAEQWTHLVPKKCWMDAAEDARYRIRNDIETDIQGFDIDGDVIKSARENAKLAGVDHLIHFQQRPVAELSHPKKYGFLITNPPYGERLEDKKDLPALYQALGERYRALDSWSMYLITSYEDAERYLGKKADKNRKIYNGMLKTYFYQYAGPKPPRREKEQK